MPNITDYEEARREFTLDVPEFFNAAVDIVDRRAELEPEKLALITVSPDGDKAERYSFDDLRRRSNRAANMLRAHGVERGDRVFIMLPRVIGWYDLMLGAIKIGAIPMPATTQLTMQDIAYRVGSADAVAVVADTDGMSKVERAWQRSPSVRVAIAVGGDGTDWTDFDASDDQATSELLEKPAETLARDPMLIYFTSGTTGPPKMVLHTHASYGIGHQVTARYWQDLGPNDVFWGVSDTGWAKAAWSKLFGQWSLGTAVLAWNGQGKPDFARMLRMIEMYDVTVFCAPPTIYRAFVTLDLSGYDFSSLRHCLAAGEALNPETFRAWESATGTRIHDGYGQTETCNVLANYPCMPIKPGSLGKPVPGYDVDVVDANGQPLGRDSEGQIAIRVKPVRPTGLFSEYWRDEAATRDAFVGDYYLTGDRAYVDGDGYFWFQSRNDDVIISAGYRIGPFEVESAVMEHPSVAEVACIGVPDEGRGQVVKAFVVLVPGWEATDELKTEIQKHVKGVTAPYKYPRQVEFIDELPKTVSGKIRRVDLREATESPAD